MGLDLAEADRVGSPPFRREWAAADMSSHHSSTLGAADPVARESRDNIASSIELGRQLQSSNMQFIQAEIERKRADTEEEVAEMHMTTSLRQGGVVGCSTKPASPYLDVRATTTTTTTTTTGQPERASVESPASFSKYDAKNQEYLRKLRLRYEGSKAAAEERNNKQRMLRKKLAAVVLNKCSKLKSIKPGVEDEDRGGGNGGDGMTAGLASQQRRLSKSGGETGGATLQVDGGCGWGSPSSPTNPRNEGPATNACERPKLRPIQSEQSAPPRYLAPAAVGMLAWKEKRGFAPDVKVFFVDERSAYNPMRHALLRRGWRENKEKESPFFHFRWTAKNDWNNAQRSSKLLEDQFVNHFQGAGILTTKMGLLETLAKVKWTSDSDPNSFAPRAYMLHDDNDKCCFIADFQLTAAEGLLKAASDGKVQPELPLYTLKLAKQLCLARILAQRHLSDDCTDLRAALKAGITYLEEGDAGATPKSVLDEEDDDGGPLEAEAAAAADFLASSAHSLRWALFLDNPWFKNAEAAHGGDGAVVKGQEDGGILQLLESCFPQTHINGARNVWIAKPGGKSRGRGIALFNHLPTLLEYCTPLKGEKWLVQKYIERPLLIMRRKFDLRQWVLVSDWNPLLVWFYGECYLRFTADDFDLGNLDIFAHLSNNSVSKYAERERSDEITQAGNMWSVARFKQHLLESYGTGRVWEEEIVPQMKAIVRQTLAAAAGEVKPRKNTCQLYGYDFMIDDSYKVWLLEINSSPTMEPSTEIATRLCAEVQEDIVKVVIDLPEALAALKAAGDSPPFDASPADIGVDTGKWETILRTQPWVAPDSYMGVSLSCQGSVFKGMQPKKASRSPKPKAQSNSSPYLSSSTKKVQPTHQPSTESATVPCSEVPSMVTDTATTPGS